VTLDATGRGLARVSTASIRQQVREALRNAIFAGVLKPGDRLVEAAIAREMGVSQTPVREAIRELENAGLVVSHPHRATFVRKYTRREMAEMYSLRAYLERLAVRLALPRLTDEDFQHLQDLIDRMVELAEAGDTAGMVEADVAFHAHIVRSSGHRLLLRTWEAVSPPNSTYFTVVALAERGLSYIAQRHPALLRAIRSRDVGVAEEAIERHISNVGAEALRLIPDDGPSDGNAS
jgi:DNA-binding GntR family transcriptional regulator